MFTRKLALMPFDLADPVWIEDDDIDLDHHIRQTVLPEPGTMEQLEALAAQLHSSMLDRSRPLWEFYVIDGRAGVALANAVYDLAPEPRTGRAPRHRRGNRYQLGVAELLTAALENQLRQVVDLAKLVTAVASRAVGAARRAWAERGRGGDRKTGSRPSLAPVTPFNASITNQRRFAGVVLPRAEVKAIGKAHGASINDMVLWLCSTALRTYLEEARQLPAKTLVAGVPISLRAEGDTRSNNQVTGTLMSLATDVADPLARHRPDRLPVDRLAVAAVGADLAVRAQPHGRPAALCQRDDQQRARPAHAAVPGRRADPERPAGQHRRAPRGAEHHGAELRGPARLRPRRLPARGAQPERPGRRPAPRLGRAAEPAGAGGGAGARGPRAA